MYGSDQSTSSVSGFKMLIGVIKTIESARGDGNININQKELEVAKKLRAHIK